MLGSPSLGAGGGWARGPATSVTAVPSQQGGTGIPSQPHWRCPKHQPPAKGSPARKVPPQSCLGLQIPTEPIGGGQSTLSPTISAIGPLRDQAPGPNSLACCWSHPLPEPWGRRPSHPATGWGPWHLLKASPGSRAPRLPLHPQRYRTHPRSRQERSQK